MRATGIHCAGALALLLVLKAAVSAEPQTVKVPVPPAVTKGIKSIEVSIDPPTAKRGQTVMWRLTLDLVDGWHTYPTKQDDAKAAANVIGFDFGFTPPADLVAVEPVKEAEGLPKIDLQLGYPITTLEGKVVWERPLVVAPQATAGTKTIEVKTDKAQVCNARGCTPFALDLKNALTVTAESVPVDPRYEEAVKRGNGATTVSPPAPSQSNGEPGSERGTAANYVDETGDYEADMEAILNQLTGFKKAHMSLIAFLLAGVFWGAVSLVTPCVFPMIPITVSYFLKQSEKEHHRPLTMATVYCATIVIVLTIAAVLLLSFFRQLSINPWMNFALGALFVFFALSLFGMYEIELPSGLARFTSAREGKGGLVGTIFMALTFTIVSFACVAPFLGGFGGTAATVGLSWFELVLGGLAFSCTFAAPFFILALFPTLLKKLPKSGSWLNSVKVVMGFLELAAALKFFRLGELVFSDNPPSFFTYDLVLGLYVGLSLLCGLYLLGVYRLPHDSPVEHLSVPRLVLSLVFLSLALYMAPGLFKTGAEGESQRPGGSVYAWVDSFLLPEPREAKGSDLVWSADLRRAIGETRKLQASGRDKRIFIDFTGET